MKPPCAKDAWATVTGEENERIMSITNQYLTRVFLNPACNRTLFKSGFIYSKVQFHWRPYTRNLRRIVRTPKSEIGSTTERSGRYHQAIIRKKNLNSTNSVFIKLSIDIARRCDRMIVKSENIIEHMSIHPAAALLLGSKIRGKFVHHRYVIVGMPN